MNRGYIRLWRKSLDAGWIKNHKLWAFWTYCLMKASWAEYDAIIGLQVVHLMPGQFVFGLCVASKETGLSIRQIRTILDFLRKAGNLTIKTTNKFSIITVINWPTYQGDDAENDTLNDKPLTNKGQHTNIKALKKENPPAISSQISKLENRYQDQEIINQAFQAIASTRKSSRIADSVRLSILQSWGKYPISQVMEGIRKYLDRQYYQQGKDEKYLLGIIRNGNTPQEYKGAPPGPIFESSGSPLLDKVRRGEIRPIIEGHRT